VFAHDCPVPVSKKKGVARSVGPLKFVTSRLPGALYATPSDDRRAKLAKALGMSKADIRVVPGGVNAADVLSLTDNVTAFANEKRILQADVVMLSACRALERKNLSRGLQIVAAIKRAIGEGLVRWIITAPADPDDVSARRVLDRLLVEREKLALRDEVCVLSTECAWAKPRTRSADLWSLFRLADVQMMPSADEPFGLAAIEGALFRQLLVLGPASALSELTTRKKEVVRLNKTETPAASAQKVLKALSGMPSQAIRRRAFKDLDWDAIAHNHLVPLIDE
jgi:glycosyltransferase involved in cell wall biosynthesis